MPDRYYWDACVFLALINADLDRVEDIDTFMALAAAGTIEIVTSVVSAVEVAFGAVEQNGNLDDDVAARIAELWRPPSPIKVVEVYQGIADDAAALMRRGLPDGWRLKPMDAIHLSTAERMEAQAFHTYDDILQRYAGQIGMPIGPPLAPQRNLNFDAD
jgi:predicted nucleic acid-binding protein